MEQFVLQFAVSGVAGYDAVVELEELLMSHLGADAEVDGHDVGQGQMNVFVWCEDAAVTFERVRALSDSRGQVSPLAAGFRDQDEGESTSLWPADAERFSLAPEETGARVEPPLSVGAVLGDSNPLTRAWSDQIGELGRVREAAGEGVRSPVSVGVVFHVDGRLFPLDFEGLRTGRLSADGAFSVEAGVPKDTTPDQPHVLVALLREAVDVAEKASRRKGVAESLNELRALVDRLEINT